MCLENPVVNSRKIFKGKDYIFLYKVVTKIGKTFHGPCQRATKYKLRSINKSNRKQKKLNLLDDNDDDKWSVHKGIHVYLNYNDAYRFACNHEYLIKVKCYKKDYVAHNYNRVVFMQVTFPRSISENKKVNKGW